MECVISKQVLRSGTSIGANITEGLSAQSKKDFINKMHIALKESSETRYWLTLLKKADYLSEVNISPLLSKLDEIIRILYSIINTSKENLKRKA